MSLNSESLSEAPVVLKFGGSSVATAEKIRAVAARVARVRAGNKRVVVTVSAMGDTTDELIDLALKVSPHAREPRNRREMDMLLTSGERISMALLSLALSDLKIDAVSLTGSQSGILTDEVHGEAQIVDVRPFRIQENLDKGRVVIVAGFQGVSRENKEITTLGRGGSDTTAVALAAALKAREVWICTDVDGIYSADPRKVPEARKLQRMGWDTALANAKAGSVVLHAPCVQRAMEASLPIRLCSSFKEEDQGTLVEGMDVKAGASAQVVAIASCDFEDGRQSVSVVGANLQNAGDVLQNVKKVAAKFALDGAVPQVQAQSISYSFAKRGDLPDLLRALHQALL